MDQVDQAYLDELLASGGQMQDSNSNPEFRDSGSELSYEGIKELAKSMGRGNRDLDMKVVMTFLQVCYKIEIRYYINDEFFFVVFVKNVG